MPPFFTEKLQGSVEELQNQENEELTIEQKLAIKKTRVSLNRVIAKMKKAGVDQNYFEDIVNKIQDINKLIDKCLEINRKEYFESQECQYTKSLCSIRDGMKMILRSHAI
ncbi:uncharacterized protein CELE_C40C9.4 [Caenorhabditis elegans]|uniref:Uncharacterized protein n=1 Tax=Caenorhabditis elegans TaxID=6239 RepID=A0A3B1E543_CAEEL|nr:Uncharacterized protein CELE_C40C9.4 [Caenorhabditis elegans]VAY52602.1 Uncharacterized protein CELE_C40C9.4 [Caenorhabditis elegans]|eukprot:NP_001355468.1 Uncharacterized protein CELE_C40C9.4 [Caenorhabditis elegans]